MTATLKNWPKRVLVGFFGGFFCRIPQPNHPDNATTSTSDRRRGYRCGSKMWVRGSVKPNAPQMLKPRLRAGVLRDNAEKDASASETPTAAGLPKNAGLAAADPDRCPATARAGATDANVHDIMADIKGACSAEAARVARSRQCKPPNQDGLFLRRRKQGKIIQTFFFLWTWPTRGPREKSHLSF
jgi:hypothetical protein